MASQEGPHGGECPQIEAVLAVVGRAWAGAVVAAMLGGATRFRQIARATPGISDAVLTARLKELCAQGLAVRDVSPGPPVEVHYRLTDAGRDLRPTLAAVQGYAHAHRELVSRWGGRGHRRSS